LNFEFLAFSRLKKYSATLEIEAGLVIIGASRLADKNNRLTGSRARSCNPDRTPDKLDPMEEWAGVNS
jgi:hypothetical protein